MEDSELISGCVALGKRVGNDCKHAGTFWVDRCILKLDCDDGDIAHSVIYNSDFFLIKNHLQWVNFMAWKLYLNIAIKSGSKRINLSGLKVLHKTQARNKTLSFRKEYPAESSECSMWHDVMSNVNMQKKDEHFPKGIVF